MMTANQINIGLNSLDLQGKFQSLNQIEDKVSVELDRGLMKRLDMARL